MLLFVYIHFKKLIVIEQKKCFKDLSVFCISKKTLFNLLTAQKKLLNFLKFYSSYYKNSFI